MAEAAEAAEEAVAEGALVHETEGTGQLDSNQNGKSIAIKIIT